MQAVLVSVPIFLLFAIVCGDEKFLSQAEIYSAAKVMGEVSIPDGYDILDVGASKGGSTQFLWKALRHYFGDSGAQEFGPKVLGIDIDQHKVDICKKSGSNCILGDVTKLDVNETSKKVHGTTAWHILEHMPTCKTSEEIWQRSSMVANHFSSFHGPDFDNKELLNTKKGNFHRFFENWHGHPCHFNSTMLDHAIRTSPRVAHSYLIVGIGRIVSSSSDWILPEGSVAESHKYNKKEHPAKINVLFAKRLHEEMRACAIYDKPTDEKGGGLSLLSALCIMDTLVFGLRPSDVVYCRSAGTAQTVNKSDNDDGALSSCLDALEKQAKQVIEMASLNNSSDGGKGMRSFV